MKRIVPAETARWIWPDPWQMCLIGLCALMLCSCRGPLRYGRSVVEPSGLPQEAYAGVTTASDLPHGPPIGPPGMEKGVPLASSPHDSGLLVAPLSKPQQ